MLADIAHLSAAAALTLQNAHAASAAVMTAATADGQSVTLTEATCTGQRSQRRAS
jgi:hypothetical protein